jgi:hypothetical protein
MQKYSVRHKRGDGFGAQYQNIIWCIIYSELNGYNYLHRKIEDMEHNYDNDPSFFIKMEQIMNIHNHYTTYNETIHKNVTVFQHSPIVYPFIENNIDYCLKSDSMLKLKNIFWENKDKNHFKNDKINIAVHIRRQNPHDGRNARKEVSDLYYLNVISYIREKYIDKNIQFHIYSQGPIERFECYRHTDTVFHLNESISDTFIGLVAAQILCTSASSLSYIAAWLSDGVIYYQQFWHPPSKDWIICDF